MNVLLIYNVSDRRCGFANYGQQMATALRRAGVDLTVWDGTYPTVYARQQLPATPFLGMFPHDVRDYDVVHLIWNAMVMNHYSGAPWAILRGGPILSWWDGGPSDASCPFEAAMQIRWSDYERAGYHYCWYPVPDWITNLPEPASMFTVGMSTIRGDGALAVKAICDRHGWNFNGPYSSWLSIDEEVQRLARSSVNVCWYHTSPIWKNRASAPSMLLASGRPLLINHDSILAHLWEAPDIYHGGEDDQLEETLEQLEAAWQAGTIRSPAETAAMLSWTVAVQMMTTVWEGACR